MGTMFTRGGVHRHAYSAPAAPEWTVRHAMSAPVQHPSAGMTSYPITSGAASFAADGAPFYNSGYLPGYESAPLPYGVAVLQLPPVAAQIDLTDQTSWDRPVFFPGSF